MLSNTRTIKENFEENGFYILRNAIDSNLADIITNDFENFNSSNEYIGLLKRTPMLASQEHLDTEKFRFKDLYINNKNVRSAIFSKSITNVLQQLFSGPFLAFQGLGFKRSTGLRIHRDSNYVSVCADHPKVIACWLALEDINENSGTIRYYPKSHLLERYKFKDGNDHWIKSDHGIFANDDCHIWNQWQMETHHIFSESFVANKGDCIFWDFDLVHEALLPRNDKTRYSLATHFCPVSQTPLYLTQNKHTRSIQYSNTCFFSSNHYPLCDISSCQELDSHVLKPIFT